MRKRLGLLVCALMLPGGLISCTAGHRASRQLDKVAASLDRYGFASVSAPFLAGPSEDFKFDLDKPASYYFERALRPQGGVRTSDVESRDTRVALRSNLEQAGVR